MQAAEVTALKGQESTIQAAKRQLGLEPVHRTGYLVNMSPTTFAGAIWKPWRSCPASCL